VTKHHRPLDNQRAPLLRNGEAKLSGAASRLPARLVSWLSCLPAESGYG